MTLYEIRNKCIIEILKSTSIHNVLDLGCGDGKLFNILCQENSFIKIGGVDISYKKIAKLRKKYDSFGHMFFYNSSFLCYNPEFRCYDGIVLSEVIEHLKKEELQILFDLIFKRYMPNMVILTTPNRSYNYHFEVLHNGLRHSSHIFELSEVEFSFFIKKLTENYRNYDFKGGYCDSTHATHLLICKKY